jgi:hypothetical protein
MTSRIVLAILFAVLSLPSSAQPGPGVVLIYCTDKSNDPPVSQSSQGAVPVDPFSANCAAEISKVLRSGYALAFAGNGERSIPFYVFVEPVSVPVAPTPSEIAVLACDISHRADDFVVRSAAASAGVAPVAVGQTARCADGISTLLGRGLALSQALVAKDYSLSAYFVLTVPEPARRSAPPERSRSRRSRQVRPAIVSCMPRSMFGEVLLVESASYEDPNIPDGSLRGRSCGEALSEFLSYGYRIVDIDTGENLGPLDVTLIQE